MSSHFCPNVSNCPVYQGKPINDVELSSHSLELYKRNYCSAGEDRYIFCKRFEAMSALNMTIPDMIMPNSQRSVEEIRNMIEKHMN